MRRELIETMVSKRRRKLWVVMFQKFEIDTSFYFRKCRNLY